MGGLGGAEGRSRERGIVKNTNKHTHIHRRGVQRLTLFKLSRRIAYSSKTSRSSGDSGSEVS